MLFVTDTTTLTTTTPSTTTKGAFNTHSIV